MLSYFRNSRYLFFGSSEFSAIVLRKLVEAGFSPLALVSNPDRPVGRKQVITPPLAKKLVLEENWPIKILQPQKLDDKFIQELKKLEVDFYLVAAYSRFLPAELLKIPVLGTLGVHPALLPKFRGSTPIQSAILSGESETGVTLYLMDERIDAGPIIKQKALSIKHQGTEELTIELAEMAGDLLIQTLPDFLEGKINPLPQDESQASYTKKFRTEDGYINFLELAEAESVSGEKAREIWRKIRAFNPEPGVWTMKAEKRVKLLEARLTDEGKLKMMKIQIEGKKPIYYESTKAR